MSKFMKYTDYDEVGKFSYHGIVEKKTKDMVTMRTVEGVMTVPVEKCVVVKRIREDLAEKINNYIAMDNGEMPIPKAKTSTSTKAPKARKARKSAGPTKRDLAIKLFGEHKGLTRKEMINVFVEELGMTTAGASTYYAVAKKAVG